MVGARGAGAGGEGAPADAGPGGPEPANVLKVFQLIGIRAPAGGGRGGAARAVAGEVVALSWAAEITSITMTVGGRTLRQVLHVERLSGGETAGFGGGGTPDPKAGSPMRSH